MLAGKLLLHTFRTRNTYRKLSQYSDIFIFNSDHVLCNYWFYRWLWTCSCHYNVKGKDFNTKIQKAISWFRNLPCLVVLRIPSFQYGNLYSDKNKIVSHKEYGKITVLKNLHKAFIKAPVTEPFIVKLQAYSVYLH